jgi:hypothetical protein
MIYVRAATNWGASWTCPKGKVPKAPSHLPQHPQCQSSRKYLNIPPPKRAAFFFLKILK